MAFPQSIMPKFLWKHVFNYLSYTDLTKAITANSTFTKLIDESNWRRFFLYDRADAIVVVKCDTKTMDGFWYHAIQTYIAHSNIDNLFWYIENDIANATKFIYYKIFIKAGKYLLDEYKHPYIFNTKPCSIEINGSKLNTKIDNDYHRYLRMVVSKFFQIKHIKFGNISCLLDKRDFIKCIYGSDNDNDNDFIAMHGHSELFVSDCIFENEALSITSINKSTITNCKFNGVGISIHNTDEDTKVITRMINLGLSNNIECNISHSIFSTRYYCISTDIKIFYEHVCLPVCYCSINFTNNTVMKANYILNTFFPGFYKYVTFMAHSNTISNTNKCVSRSGNVIFKYNHFNNVLLLYDEYSTNVIADNTNVFVDYSSEFMEQII